nr:39S ribosomal protein L19 [Haemonchus contortus]
MATLTKPSSLRLARAVAVQLLPSRNSADTCPSRPAMASRKESDLKKKMAEFKHIPDFPLIYPDFLQSPVWNRRNPLFEELIHKDMLERRMNIDIPEFYVGSIVAVTTSEKCLGSKEHRFVGICILTAGPHSWSLPRYKANIGGEVNKLESDSLVEIRNLHLQPSGG